MTAAEPPARTGARPRPAARSQPQGGTARLSGAELRYLTDTRLLGRLATCDADGQPHVVPLGWSYHEASGTFTVSGRNFATTRKYRNVLANPRAALVIDDVLPPWQPRGVHIQGHAQAVPAAQGEQALIRITPTTITSWGLENETRPDRRDRTIE